MVFRDVRSLFDYWQDFPPENEMLEMFARVYTTWKPRRAKKMTAAEHQAEHMASLEARWKSGQSMNVKQIFEAMGGGGGVSFNASGVFMPAQAIRDFPGAH